MRGARATPLLAFVLLLFTAAPPAPAAASFKVSPTLLHLRRAGGEAALGTIGVELKGERGRRYRVVVQDIRQLPDGSQAYAPPSGSPFSASSWVSVVPARFSGGPDRTQPLQYRVRVPARAEPGDHLASISVQRLPRATAATAAAIEAVSVRMTVRVPGRQRPRAEIVSLDAPGLADGGPVRVRAAIRNSGNVTLDFDRAAGGRLAVLDGEEARASRPLEGSLFPGATREYELAWDDPPLLGHFEALAAVDPGGRAAVRETRGVWVIPWRQALALLLVVLAALSVAYGVRRRRWGY